MSKRIKSSRQRKAEQAEMELQAIDSVRKELTDAVQKGLGQFEIEEIHARLISLYAVLDIHNVQSIIHLVDYRKVS